MSSNNVDDYDDFNSFLETVLSECDEPPETPAIPGTTASEPSNGIHEKVNILKQANEEESTAGGAGHMAEGGDVAGVPLTAADLESTCSTGAFQIQQSGPNFPSTPITYSKVDAPGRRACHMLRT